MATQQQHLRFLDGMRAVAALIVVFHHAWLQSWPYTIYPELKPVGAVALLTGWLAFGKLAVTAFIVVSGYCLMLPVLRTDGPIEPVRFFRRRCQRILPPYYAALALALLLDLFLRPHSMTAYDDSFPVTVGGILSHLFLVQNFSGNPYQIAGPLWSIAVEFQIYLFFPLFIRFYRRFGMLATLGLTSAFGYAASFALGRAGLENTFAHYIAMFGFGMASAHLAFKLRNRDARSAALLGAAALPALALLGVKFHHRYGSDKLVTDAIMGLAVACILLLATIRPSGMLSRLLSLRPLVWIGSFSYSIYLIHFPLQQLFWQSLVSPLGLSRPASFAIVATVGTVVIVALAHGFFLLVEKPCLKTSGDGRRRAALAETAG